jgi:hypothetical protein
MGVGLGAGVGGLAGAEGRGFPGMTLDLGKELGIGIGVDRMKPSATSRCAGGSTLDSLTGVFPCLEV